MFKQPKITLPRKTPLISVDGDVFLKSATANGCQRRSLERRGVGSAMGQQIKQVKNENDNKLMERVGYQDQTLHNG